jgi:hypothetical protein
MVSLRQRPLVQAPARKSSKASHSSRDRTDAALQILSNSPNAARHSGAVGSGQHNGTERAFTNARSGLLSAHFESETEAATSRGGGRRQTLTRSPCSQPSPRLLHASSPVPLWTHRSWFSPSGARLFGGRMASRCVQTLKRKWRMSPSFTTYSLPSARSRPA